MTTVFHGDVLVNGLQALTQQSVTFSLSKRRPADLSEASTSASSGGTRISDEVSVSTSAMEVVDYQNGKFVSFGEALFTIEVGASTTDIFLSAYDSGRLLAAALMSDTGLTPSTGENFEILNLMLGFGQPLS